MLRPVDNGFRERRSLNGLWRFRADAGAEGGRQEWWRRPLPAALEMPVPASYNDVLVDAGLQGHVGDVWYQTAATVPRGWAGQRVVLRFDAATHAATVWVDDVEVAHHQGGYTPFEADISSQATPGRPLRITVRVSNELTWSTIPPGVVEVGSDAKKVQRYFHDFFNYAGLHRSVWLCATPQTHVRDIAVTTRLEEGSGTRRLPPGHRGGGRCPHRPARRRRGARRHRRGCRGRAARPRRPPLGPRGWVPLHPRGVAPGSAGRPGPVRPSGRRPHRGGGRRPPPRQRSSPPPHRIRAPRGQRGPRQGSRRRAHGPRLLPDALDRCQLLPHLALPVCGGGHGVRGSPGVRGDRRGPRRRPQPTPGSSRGAAEEPRSARTR